MCSSRHKETRGDSMERLHEKEQIKLDAFEQKSAILRKHKEKEEHQKMDAKLENVCTIQVLGGRDNPLCKGIVVAAAAAATVGERVVVGPSQLQQQEK
jgi:hypothetical protein